MPEITGKAELHLAPLSALPEHTKEAVVSVVILALGYFLGSAVSRISDDFFADNELSQILPTELSIRVDVYYQEYCAVHNVIAAGGLPKELLDKEKVPVAFCSEGAYDTWSKKWSDVVMEFFRLQESKLLLQGEDRTARLRGLHDQSAILRGATLNGIVLSTLCLFGFCASFRPRPKKAGQASGTVATACTARASVTSWSWRKIGLTYAAAVALIVYGGYCLSRHFSRGLYHDPPLAEGVMVLLGIAGLLAPAQAESRWTYARSCGLSLALTLIAYGA